jgi:hypothetical protein
MTYAVIEAAVDKGIRDIEENTARGIRNLVDLGTHFSTGRFQKEFFDIAERTLKNENSGYYKLTNHVIKYINHKILKRFGINLGYNSWTYGADKIRENEKIFGFNIPWTIIFDLRIENKNMLSAKEISGILTSAESLGIYSGMFFIDKNMAYLESLLSVLKSHNDSAYFLFLTPEMITEKIADSVISASNTIIVLNINASGDNHESDIAAGILFEKRCLYGSYSIYDDSNIEYIMSEKNSEQLMELHCIFLFLIKGNQVSEQNSKNLSQFILHAKDVNEYPLFTVDFYEDLAHVDRVISVEDCFMSVASDGTISASSMNNKVTNLNVRNQTLQSILRTAMPKTQYT